MVREIRGKNGEVRYERDLLDLAMRLDHIQYRRSEGVARLKTCRDRDCRDGRVCPDCRDVRRKERERARGRARYDRSKSAASQRQWKYRLSPAEYAKRLTEQDGCCAICRRAGVKLAVDHDHATDKARGLLCWRCNSWLAGIETPEFVERARAYLERWNHAERTRSRERDTDRPQNYGAAGQAADPRAP